MGDGGAFLLFCPEPLAGGPPGQHLLDPIQLHTGSKLRPKYAVLSSVRRRAGCRVSGSSSPSKNGYPLGQSSPIFLAPGISFVEDNFSMDQGEEDGFRMS